jgi:hypothetical protein
MTQRWVYAYVRDVNSGLLLRPERMYAVARSRMRDGKGLQLSTMTICDLGVVHIQFGLRIDGLQSVDYYRILLSSTMSLTRMCQACRNFEIVEGRNVLTLKEMMTAFNTNNLSSFVIVM